MTNFLSKLAPLKHMFLGQTGTPELGRIMLCVMVLAFLIYQGVAFWMGDPWSPVEFATGGGGLLTGGGAGILMKDIGVTKGRQA